MASPLRDLLARFLIGVDASEVDKGHKKVEGFKEYLEKAGKAVKAFIGYEAIKQVGEFVEGTVEAATELKAMALRVGTTTDELQAMRLAAAEAHVSSEALSNGLRFLNRNIAEGGKHGGEAHATLLRLGISLKDASGQARPAGDVMADLADAIAEIPDAAKKTQIAMQVLGRGGAELIPLLNRGHEAFDEARQSMQELGGGMSEEFIEAAEKAEVATQHLSFAWSGFRSQIVNAILPGFTDIMRGLTTITADAIAFEKKSHVLEDAFAVGKVAAIVVALLKIKSTIEAITKAQVIAFATNPIVLWGAAIVAGILIYNDLKTALEGGESVFGDYFGQTGIKQLGEDLKTAADWVDTLYTAFVELWHTIEAGTSTVAGALKWLGTAGAPPLPQSLQDEYSKMQADQQAQASALFGQGKAAADKAFGTDWQEHYARNAARHAASEPVGAAARQAQIEAYQDRYRAQLPTHGLGAAAATAGSSMVQHNDVKIEQHIGPGTDPKAVGRETQDGVQGAYARFRNNTNVGAVKP